MGRFPRNKMGRLFGDPNLFENCCFGEYLKITAVSTRSKRTLLVWTRISFFTVCGDRSGYQAMQSVQPLKIKSSGWSNPVPRLRLDEFTRLSDAQPHETHTTITNGFDFGECHSVWICLLTRNLFRLHLSVVLSIVCSYSLSSLVYNSSVITDNGYRMDDGL